MTEFITCVMCGHMALREQHYDFKTYLTELGVYTVCRWCKVEDLWKKFERKQTDLFSNLVPPLDTTSS